MNRLVVGSNPTARATSNPSTIGRRDLALAAVALAGVPANAHADDELRLGWPAGSIADLAAPAAARFGLFAQYGLDVTLVGVAPTGKSLSDALSSHRVDAVVGPVSLLLEPLRLGLDARITTGISGGGLRLLAEKRSGLRHIEDMKHARIGVGDLDGPSRLFFSIMMRRKGIDPFKEVEWIVVDPSQQEAALRARRVDAIAASDPQAFFLLRAVLAVEIASNVSGSYRQRVANVLACGGRLVRDRRREATSLTRALRQAASWGASHVRAAAGLVAPWAPKLGEADRIAMIATETVGEHPAGHALIDDVAEYADEMRLLGTFPYELNAETFARQVCDDVMA